MWCSKTAALPQNTVITLTNRQARQFILLKHGLLGEHKFAGKQGALEFIRQAGCIQYDPVDVCGRNPDIILHSRVKGYTKKMLEELLYEDRRLIDYFDKNLSIFPVEDLPAFLNSRLSREYTQANDSRGGDAVKRIEPLIRRLIEERGHITAKEIDVDETIVWYWSVVTSLPRAALESMYIRGELIIHHKTGTNKSYAFMKDYVPAVILNAGPPFNNEEERLAWHVRRRVGAVGLLWDRAGDAWLGLSMKAAERGAAFNKLLGDGKIIKVMVEGIKDPLYCLTDDMPIIEGILRDPEIEGILRGPEVGPPAPQVPAPRCEFIALPEQSSRCEHTAMPEQSPRYEFIATPEPAPRCEFIAPLDSFIWDRKLTKALFGFEYTWEIYTPAVKRKYGGYVLPILYGEQFIGRIEAACERKTGTLTVKNIWYEDGVKRTKKMQTALDNCLKRFAKFNGCGAAITRLDK